MKKIFIAIVAIFLGVSIYAQQDKIDFSSRSKLVLNEKKMQRISHKSMFDTSQLERQKSIYELINLLKESLKIKGSFYYNFDSLKYISIKYSPDSAFRVFTFQLIVYNGTYRHYGCIQRQNSNYKIIPLLDMSDTFPLPPQYATTNRNWYGCLYYDIIMKKIKDKPIYFLFGIDGNDIFSTKKMIDVMYFDKDTICKFGLPIFSKEEKKKDKLTKEIVTIKSMNYKYVLEYAKTANISLKFDSTFNMIVHDHTASQNPKYDDLSFTKVPDGTYEGLKWENEVWKWQDLIKFSKEDSNKPIIPVPLNETKVLKNFED